MSSPHAPAEAAPHPSAARRRILLLCPEPPAPPTWGFALRVYHLGRELARRHDVTLLTYDHGDPSRDWRRLEKLFRVERVEAPGTLRNKRLGQLRHLLSRHSFHLGSLLSPAMQHALDELTGRECFDVIQVESSQMAGFDFPAGPALILDEHNVEHDLLRQVAAAEASLPRRLYQSVEYRKVRREEVAAWRRADGCTVTSLQDERSVREAAPTTPTRVVPNGVDLDHFTPGSGPVDPDAIVFVGSINYRPNTDAVLHFAERILPLVRLARPQATFHVVGQGAPELVRRLEGPRLHIVGGVADVRPHLAGAAVVAVPLRMGGGTRLKVLEALAMGQAVVSTSLGCEGIDVEQGRHLLIADDPEAFAAAVVRLMGDPDLRRELGLGGRDLVERRYGWTAAGATLEAFHAQVVGAAQNARARPTAALTSGAA
jgi:glycosyltransferase involved in cell wall biosynthesis